MFVSCNTGAYDAGRCPFLGPYRLAAVSAAGDALARRDGDDKYAPTERAELAGRSCRALPSWNPSWRRRRASSALIRWRFARQLSLRARRSWSPPVKGKRAAHDELFPQRSAGSRRGAVQVEVKEWRAQPKRIGTKVRGVGVSLSCYVGGTIGFDGLLVINSRGTGPLSLRASATWERNR
jgi:hypothetical protein